MCNKFIIVNKDNIVFIVYLRLNIDLVNEEGSMKFGWFLIYMCI